MAEKPSAFGGDNHAWSMRSFGISTVLRNSIESPTRQLPCFPWFLPSSLRQPRAAGELAQRGVAYILEVGDADFAGVEAVSGEIAQKRKEGHALAEGAILFGIFPISDQVQDFCLLLSVAIHEDVAVTIRASGIHPEEPAAELKLIFRVLAGEEIDEFRRAGFHRAAGLFILGDDGVAQK